MVKYKYGTFDEQQIDFYKTRFQKKIFWLILYTDENTRHDFGNIDVEKYHVKCMEQLAGFNSLFGYSPDMVDILVTLECALNVLQDHDGFDFTKYRKLILDAGGMVKRLRIGEYYDSL